MFNQFSKGLSQQTFVGLQDVLKASWRHVLNTYSKRLQRNNLLSSKTSWRRFRDKILLRWRSLLEVFKTYLQDVSKTYLQDVFKTFTGNVYCEYLYLKNIKSVFDKSMSDISNLANEGGPKMHWLVPNNYDIHTILKIKQHFHLKN